MLAHLDSDLYASVLDSLNATYDRLQHGGLLILDDFFHPSQGPPRALAAFCNQRGIAPVLHVAFPYSVFLVKGQPDAPRTARCHDGFVYSFHWLRQEPLFRTAFLTLWPAMDSEGIYIAFHEASDRVHRVYRQQPLGNLRRPLGGPPAALPHPTETA